MIKPNTKPFKRLSQKKVQNPVLNKKVVLNASNEARRVHKDTGLHIILPDVHSPWDNKVLTEGILKFIKDLGSKLKGFHILGDFLEMNSISSHSKGEIPLKGITLGYEYQEGNKLLDKFEKTVPKGIQKNFLYGNHEARYFSITKKSDTNKFADAIINPTKALKLKERGYKVYEDWKNDYIKLGNHMYIIHGEFCTNNPAKTHLQKYKQSCIFGHTHRSDSYYEGNMAAFNIGALADFNAPCFDYVSRIQKLNWMNGFAIVQIDEQGFFHTQVITAYNNHFWYNGKKY